jgi:hypothetical protein
MAQDLGETTSAQPAIDPAQTELAMQGFRSEQNLMMGVAGGAAAALAGAAVWAIITVATDFQIGWMAVGVGFLVGYSVRALGKGIDRQFGIAGASLAFLGCVLGNLLAVCIMAAKQEKIPVMDILSQLTPGLAGELMKATFHPLDLLFYGIALYEGYKLSLRQLTPQEMDRALGR